MCGGEQAEYRWKFTDPSRMGLENEKYLFTPRRITFSFLRKSFESLPEIESKPHHPPPPSDRAPRTRRRRGRESCSEGGREKNGGNRLEKESGRRGKANCAHPTDGPPPHGTGAERATGIGGGAFPTIRSVSIAPWAEEEGRKEKGGKRRRPVASGGERTTEVENKSRENCESHPTFHVPLRHILLLHPAGIDRCGFARRRKRQPRSDQIFQNDIKGGFASFFSNHQKVEVELVQCHRYQRRRRRKKVFLISAIGSGKIRRFPSKT